MKLSFARKEEIVKYLSGIYQDINDLDTVLGSLISNDDSFQAICEALMNRLLKL